jgi:hypothetical protein
VLAKVGYDEAKGEALLTQLLSAQTQLISALAGSIHEGVDANTALAIVFEYAEFDAELATQLVNDDPHIASTLLDLAKRKCFYSGKRLRLPVAAASSAVLGADSDDSNFGHLAAQIHKLRHQAEAVTTVLTAERSYCTTTDDGSLSFDPHFLVFEFVCGFMLRRRQVELVQDFMHDAKHGKSRVEQVSRLQVQ